MPTHKKSARLPLLEAITSASYPQLFTLWITLNIVFALLYFLISTYSDLHGLTDLFEIEQRTRLFNSLYFSFITATTTGYGDILPMGFSKVLACVQAIVAFLIFAIFISRLSTHNQDRH